MFEHLGYYKEYYVNGKFIGTTLCDKDREVMGYNGKIVEVTKVSLELRNKKFIKANTEVVTQLFPLCGNFLNKK